MKRLSGISLVALIITIVVIIILAAISIAGTIGTIDKARQADFQNNVDILNNKLRTYHQDAELASLNYLQNNLNWAGGSATPTGTGKVTDGTNEDAISVILGSIPQELVSILTIQNGKLKFTGLTEEQENWLAGYNVIIGEWKILV